MSAPTPIWKLNQHYQSTCPKFELGQVTKPSSVPLALDPIPTWKLNLQYGSTSTSTRKPTPKKPDPIRPPSPEKDGLPLWKLNQQYAASSARKDEEALDHDVFPAFGLSFSQRNSVVLWTRTEAGVCKCACVDIVGRASENKEKGKEVEKENGGMKKSRGWGGEFELILGSEQDQLTLLSDGVWFFKDWPLSRVELCGLIVGVTITDKKNTYLS
jgi:hypothetical protein